MEPAVQKTRKRKATQVDVEALIECNRILKEHLDYLRARLNKTEAVLEMYIQATDVNEKSDTLPPINKIYLN